MRVLNKIYKLSANLYSNVFAKHEDEIVWVAEDNVANAIQKLRAEFQGITVSSISPIFGCILYTPSISYDNSVYLVNMVLKHDSEISVHVLARDFSEIIDMCAERYLVLKKIEIHCLEGTVLPED